MIELDFVSHDMFDLPPLSEYELYVKKFGADDTRQVSLTTHRYMYRTIVLLAFCVLSHWDLYGIYC